VAAFRAVAGRTTRSRSFQQRGGAGAMSAAYGMRRFTQPWRAALPDAAASSGVAEPAATGAAYAKRRDGLRRQQQSARGLALLCAVLALGPWGADARRKLHQSDESGETGDAATSSEMSLKPSPPPSHPPTPPIQYPPHAEIPGTTLVVKMLDAYPEAVCNDGSPGGYYWSRGSDPSLWVVYLQGGASCA
jgi:hypothetical protein